jgi:hypothetical protein
MFVEWIKITESHSWELSEYTLMKSGIHRFLNSNFIDLTRVLEALHRHEYGNKDPEKKEYRTEFNNILSELEDPKSTFLKQHACLCDNFSFCNRMEDLLNFIPQLNDEKKESIAKRIRDTRNLLIHLDEDKKSHIVKGKDLWELTFLLETVFRINILKKLSVFRDVKDVVFEHFMVLNSLEPYCDN